MQPQFAAALPPHVPPARFVRVAMTAVQSNPELLQAERKTLFAACMRAAQDGLLPDGREGALVIFKGKVQWMPMIAGILKKVRQSGELLSIAAHVVHARDEFRYQLGDEERVYHVPYLDGEPGEERLVYAIAKTRDGGVYREIMTVAEIEKVRAVSRAREGGPWSTWWGEMAKKTVLRRLAKRLPMSTDADEVLRREDEDDEVPVPALPGSVADLNARLRPPAMPGPLWPRKEGVRPDVARLVERGPVPERDRRGPVQGPARHPAGEAAGHGRDTDRRGPRRRRVRRGLIAVTSLGCGQSGCSWWAISLAFVAGIGVGQLLLMTALAVLSGGNPERDEHERGF